MHWISPAPSIGQRLSSTPPPTARRNGRLNALKHAFPNSDQSGSVTVDYAAKGQGWALSVEDDGVGIGRGDGPGTPGLGTGIVDALAKQLGATVTTSDSQPGTKVSIEHP